MAHGSIWHVLHVLCTAQPGSALLKRVVQSHGEDSYFPIERVRVRACVHACMCTNIPTTMSVYFCISDKLAWPAPQEVVKEKVREARAERVAAKAVTKEVANLRAVMSVLRQQQGLDLARLSMLAEQERARGRYPTVPCSS